jgi:hypothetical protein
VLGPLATELGGSTLGVDEDLVGLSLALQVGERSNAGVLVRGVRVGTVPATQLLDELALDGDTTGTELAQVVQGRPGDARLAVSSMSYRS